VSATLWVLLGLAASSFSVGCYQLWRIRAARQEYAERLLALKPAYPSLDFAAVSDEAITLHLVVPALRGYPSVDEFRTLSMSQQTLYRDALRDRIALSRFFAGTLAVLGAALVALTLERLLQAVASTWLAILREGWPPSASTWPATLWFLALLTFLSAPALGVVNLRATARRAAVLDRAYRRAAGAQD
jgi:hypothetical protein